MSDYDSGAGLSEEEQDGNFAMFIDEEPLNFGDAVHSKKW